jgi:hypothetical protein
MMIIQSVETLINIYSEYYSVEAMSGFNFPKMRDDINYGVMWSLLAKLRVYSSY